MKSRFFILILLFCYSATFAADKEIRYVLSPVLYGNQYGIKVSMSFMGNPSGITRINLPMEAGLSYPVDFLAIVNITGATKNYRSPDDSLLHIFEHKPGSRITFTYVVHNAAKDSVPDNTEVYLPVINQRYLYMIGNSLFAVPDDSVSLYKVQCVWQSFPRSWNFISTYDNGKEQKIKTTLPDLRNAIYMGGDYRIHKMRINDRPLFFAIRGSWNFTDEEVSNIIKATVSAQRQYWNDNDFSRYTVSLTPMKYGSESERSVNGRALHNTFVSVGTNSKSFGLIDLTYLYNHEMMHHWIGQIIKQGEPENRFKWFAEGFTEFFTYEVMRDHHLLSDSAYRLKINDILSEYYRDSTHQWPNEKLEEGYSTSGEIGRLPYLRGNIFAMYLDAAIRKKSNSSITLKDVIATMLKEARAGMNIFTYEWLLSSLRKTTGEDYFLAFKKFIDDGKFIAPADWTAVSDNTILRKLRIFDHGFTTETGKIQKNVKIIHVKKGSGVEAAGVRTGDILTGYSTNFSVSDSSTISVKRDGQELKFRFVAGEEIEVMQLK